MAGAGVIASIRRAFMRWYAERYGERPRCHQCDSPAAWVFFGSGEPVCLRHCPDGSKVPGYVRGLHWKDWLTDDYEAHP